MPIVASFANRLLDPLKRGYFAPAYAPPPPTIDYLIIAGGGGGGTGTTGNSVGGGGGAGGVIQGTGYGVTYKIGRAHV